MEFDQEDLQILHMLMGAQMMSLSPPHVDRETLEQLSLSLSQENSEDDDALRYPELFRNQSPEEFRQNLYRSFIRPPQIEHRSLQADLLLRELFLQMPDGASRKKPDQNPRRISPMKTLEELKHDVGSELADLGTYDPNRVFELLQFFGSILIEYPESKNQVADCLADLGYTSLVTEHMSQISVLDALHSENARTLCTYTLCLCLNLSACSAKFANCLARDGAVKLQTEILLYEPYLSEGANVEIVSLIRTSIDILNNIARCTQDKTCFEKENTSRALEQILTWNNGCLEVRAMLTLAFVMNDDQLMAHTDDNQIIRKIVFWLNKACDKKERSHCSFSSRDIAESLTKLAANDFNKEEIIRAGGLKALAKMLGHSDTNEQICAAECIMTIALDVKLRPAIVSEAEVIDALLDLGESSHEEVRLKGMCTFLLLADMGDLREMITVSDLESPSTASSTTSSQEPVTTGPQQSLPSSSQNLTTPMQYTRSQSQEANFRLRQPDGRDHQPQDSSTASQPVNKTQSQHNISRVPILTNISSQQSTTTPQQLPLPTQLHLPSNTTKSVSTPSPKLVTSQAPKEVTLPTQMSNPSPRKPVDDGKEKLLDAEFFAEYLTLRGVFSDDVKYILGNSTQQNQRQAILEYASKKEKSDIFSEALKYNDTYIENFKVVIQTSLKNANSQFKDGIYTNISWNSIREMVFNLTQRVECKVKYTSMEAYGYQYSLNLIKHLFSFDLGEKIGNYLTELRYSEIAGDVILRLKHEDILQMNNNFAYTSATLSTCISYSDVSKEFVKSLVAAGMVESLTAHINEECFLQNLDDEFVYASMTDFLTILYNIAYHLDRKQCFKNKKTTEAIKNFPVKNNEKIEITVMLTLLYSLDEQELDNLPDVSNVIENIIKYMRGALENKPTRRYSGMSLSELTRGLTVLAIKSSNRIKIACKDEAVAVFAEMLRHNDPREHISSARCLQALAVESTVRKRLLEFPDLVVAMEELRLSGSLNVRKCVEDALAMLRKSIEEDETDETPMKRNISFSNDSELTEGTASADIRDKNIVYQAIVPTPKRGFRAFMGKLARRIRPQGSKKSYQQTLSFSKYNGRTRSVINLNKDEERTEGDVSINCQAINMDGQAFALTSQMPHDSHFNAESGDLSAVVQQLARSVSQMNILSQSETATSHQHAANVFVFNHSNIGTNTFTNIVQEKGRNVQSVRKNHHIVTPVRY